jgi:hypothetical protein
MTQWWQEGYPGGPMIAAKFPRPVYPPDAAPGKTPSTNAEDIEAYKRIVSRLGRWPWSKFDRAYSNAFSHGRAGGNVGDSGVAGTQRQGGLQDTGWIGEATFNFYRSARIPEGLPHAGAPAMDANAQSLLALAYTRFHPPAAAKTVRVAALNEAVRWLGTKESPAESNLQPFGAWYGMNGVPWCAIACAYWFEHGGPQGSPSFTKGVHYSYVPYIVSDAQAGLNGLQIVSAPIPGDLVAYDWYGGGYDHVGLFESGDNFQWTAIEANTSTSDNSNGGEVMRRTRQRTDAYAVAFVRVAEPVAA